MIIGLMDSSSFSIAHCNLRSHPLSSWNSKPYVTGSTAVIWHAAMEMLRTGGTSSLCAFLLPDQRPHHEYPGDTEGGGKGRNPVALGAAE